MNYKRINVCICDTDGENCAHITEKIKQWCCHYDKKMFEMWVDCFHSGKAMKAAMETVRYDIAFIEKDLCDMNGLKLGAYIRREKRQNHMQIVYMTRDSFYTMELFEIRPLHVLMKPINEKELFHALCKSFNLMEKNKGDFYYVKDRVMQKEEIDNILYFESMNRQIKMHTLNETVLFYGRLKDIQERLEDYEFFYVHQSFVVNRQYIKKMSGSRKVVLENGDVLQISYNRREDVFRRFTLGNI